MARALRSIQGEMTLAGGLYLASGSVSSRVAPNSMRVLPVPHLTAHRGQRPRCAEDESVLAAASPSAIRGRGIQEELGPLWAVLWESQLHGRLGSLAVDARIHASV